MTFSLNQEALIKQLSSDLFIFVQFILRYLSHLQHKFTDADTKPNFYQHLCYSEISIFVCITILHVHIYRAFLRAILTY